MKREVPVAGLWRLTMKNNINFETTLSKLEDIVKKLESGNVGLSESLELYEEGISLSNSCKEMLENAKQKIEVIKNENYTDSEFDMQVEDLK